MNRRKETALAALLSHKTVKEAAEAIQISESTLYRYLKEEDFRQAYRAARKMRIECATQQIQDALDESIMTLRGIMEQDDNAASVRVSAARTLLEYALKMTDQIDILERLEALEDAENERKREG